MSNFSTFFPSGGGGAGGGILNEQVFSSSGSFDPAASGLSVGDKIIILCVGGGGSGSPSTVDMYQYGGAGGYVQYKNHVLTSVSVIPITIGAGGIAPAFTGGALLGVNGGNTSAGSIVTSLGGQGGKGFNYPNYNYHQNVQGPHWGATACSDTVDQAAAGSAGPGLDGYGPGGGTYVTSGSNLLICGARGGSLGAPGSGGFSGWYATEDGTNGIIKIYY
mgnify:CR=1 FL=1|tara:strand:+ start:1205 stop:1861 length:657 start_codon:yes stop_codon:yes gene_type:complete